MQKYDGLNITALTNRPRPIVEIFDKGGGKNPVAAFVDWDEINEFINQLRCVAHEAFGDDYSDPMYDI